MGSSTIHIRITEDCLQALDARAAEEGRTRAAMAGNILLKALGVKRLPRITNGKVETSGAIAEGGRKRHAEISPPSDLSDVPASSPPIKSADVAPMVEQPTRNRQVAGLSPAVGSKHSRDNYLPPPERHVKCSTHRQPKCAATTVCKLETGTET